VITVSKIDITVTLLCCIFVFTELDATLLGYDIKKKTALLSKMKNEFTVKMTVFYCY